LLVLEAERRGYARHPAVVQAVEEIAIATMQVKDLDQGPAAVPEAEVKRLFEEQKPLRSKPRVRRASHVQVATEAEAQALLKELGRADALTFAAVARERSQDERSRRQGGELGHFDEQGRLDTGAGAIPPELARAAFAQKIGTMSRKPIAHANGFSVLYVSGEIAAIEPALASLEGELREQLRKERLTRTFDALIEQLRKRHPVQTHPELLNAVELDPPTNTDLPQGFPATPADPRQPDQAVEDDGA
jgi:foldase protein PrsA